MKLEDFLPKVKEFFGTFHGFLEKRKNDVIETGNKGRAGKIRDATLKLLTPAVERMKNIIEGWNIEKTSTIMGEYNDVKASVAVLKEEDEIALSLLERAQSIWEKSKHGVPDTVKRAVVAHHKLDEETGELRATLAKLVAVEKTVDELSHIPAAKVEPIFSPEILLERKGFVTEYTAKLDQMEERFTQKQAEAEASVTTTEEKSNSRDINFKT